jgi:hypothetical protein
LRSQRIPAGAEQKKMARLHSERNAQIIEDEDVIYISKAA